ncbi:MAG: hypothetical protein H6Q14_733 [Bacteroidetes bacterium]|jgi:hypothetical protein|nr:hypothetical protein [Bacteroidota bacterium]
MWLDKILILRLNVNIRPSDALISKMEDKKFFVDHNFRR